MTLGNGGFVRMTLLVRTRLIKRVCLVSDALISSMLLDPKAGLKIGVVRFDAL